MTPFSNDFRTATISLNKREEEIVRRGFNKDNAFEEAVAQIILEKLNRSLVAQDALLGPVGHTPPKIRVKSEELIDF